jgi:hypothetical protein
MISFARDIEAPYCRHVYVSRSTVGAERGITRSKLELVHTIMSGR